MEKFILEEAPNSNCENGYAVTLTKGNDELNEIIIQ